MFDEERDPITKKPKLKNLSNMSLDELQDYITQMRDEITRVEAEIKRKKAHMDAASTFFKKGTE